ATASNGVLWLLTQAPMPCEQVSSVVPAAPYTNDIPYSMIADDNAPMRKYFTAASLDRSSCLRQPASTNVGIVIVSSATKIDTRSRADDMTNMPSSEVRSRK